MTHSSVAYSVSTITGSRLNTPHRTLHAHNPVPLAPYRGFVAIAERALSLHRIFQYPYSLYLDFDYVTDLHRAYSPRSAGNDNISRKKSHHARDI